MVSTPPTCLQEYCSITSTKCLVISCVTFAGPAVCAVSVCQCAAVQTLGSQSGSCRVQSPVGKVPPRSGAASPGFTAQPVFCRTSSEGPGDAGLFCCLQLPFQSVSCGKTWLRNRAGRTWAGVQEMAFLKIIFNFFKILFYF